MRTWKPPVGEPLRPAVSVCPAGLAAMEKSFTPRGVKDFSIQVSGGGARSELAVSSVEHQVGIRRRGGGRSPGGAGADIGVVAVGLAKAVAGVQRAQPCR